MVLFSVLSRTGQLAEPELTRVVFGSQRDGSVGGGS